MLLRHLQVIDTVLAPLKEKYDYILIDSHPEISDLLRAVIYACDYCVSPVKLDLQSSIGVPSVIGAIQSVNRDVALMKSSIFPNLQYKPTVFAGAIGMMAREYGGSPKQSEREELQRLQRTGTVFNSYTTEGDGLRRAAQERIPVFNINNTNANKQSAQLKDITVEFLAKCP